MMYARFAHKSRSSSRTKMWRKHAHLRTFSTKRRIFKQKAFFSEVAGSFKKHNVEYSVFDDVLCEPSEESMIKGACVSQAFSKPPCLAVDFAKQGQYDCFIAVGGGSVIDTCKASVISGALRPFLIGHRLGCSALLE